MSDFLAQFEGDVYKKGIDTPEPSRDEAIASISIEGDEREIVQGTPIDSGSKIAPTTHYTEKDEGHNRRMMIRYALIALVTLIVCISTLSIFYLSNQVVVKEFVGTPVDEARTWGLANRITLETTSEFSLEYDEGIIISWEKEAGEKIQKGSVLRLVVSKGADPDERIELPDFAKMTTMQVRAWRGEVKALNASVNEIFDEEVEKGRFIRLEFPDSSVTASTYTRKDGLLIYMSKGKETFEKNIIVPDFTDKSRMEVEAWAKENSIKVTFEEATSEKVMVGAVIRQSVAAGEKIAKHDEMTVTLSLGRSVTVPNFNTLSLDEATSYSGLSVQIIRRYSDAVSFGRVISQSPSAGTVLIGDDAKVTVTYSLGRPYIDNLVGDSEGRLAEYFYSFTSQGANISYWVVYVDSHEPRGTVVAMSKHGQFLAMTDGIEISVSRGNLPPPPVVGE